MTNLYISGDNKELHIGDEVYYLYARVDTLFPKDITIMPKDLEITKFTIEKGKIKGLAQNVDEEQIILFDNSVVVLLMSMCRSLNPFGSKEDGKSNNWQKYYEVKPEMCWFDKDIALSYLKEVIDYAQAGAIEEIKNFFKDGYDYSEKRLKEQEEKKQEKVKSTLHIINPSDAIE